MATSQNIPLPQQPQQPNWWEVQKPPTPPPQSNGYYASTGLPNVGGGGGGGGTGGGGIGGPSNYSPTSPLAPQQGIPQPTAPGGFVSDPTGNWYQTPQTKGKNAGEALKALQDASGLNLLGSFNSAASGTGAGGGTAPHVAPPDFQVANAAAFARAKDQAGQTARAALQGLQGEMAGRGLLGSGIEAGQTRQIVENAAQGSNEMSREQAIQGAQLGARAGELGYTGDITQRGQDLQAQMAQQARQQQMIQGLLSSINLGGVLY